LASDDKIRLPAETAFSWDRNACAFDGTEVPHVQVTNIRISCPFEAFAKSAILAHFALPEVGHSEFK
jgi:hypothetical protein